MSATNGQTSHGIPTPDDLDSQLQTARKRLELAQVTRRLEAIEKRKPRIALRESASLDGWDTFLSGYSDLIDRFRGPDRDLIFPVSTAYDRRYGANWPFWRTWQDHARIRASSRVVTGTSGLAYGVLNAIASYVVGDGMLAGATATHDSVDPALVSAIQNLCDSFYELNEFAAVQQELVFRDRRDGEFFLRLFHKDNGNTFIRTVEPEQVVEPPNKTLDEASFGIFVDPEDLMDVRGFWVSYDGDHGNGDFVPSNEMFHSKCNVDRIIKRGMPDYAFDTLDLIKTASRLIENIGQGAAIQAAIAFVRQHAAADSTAMADFVDGLASYEIKEPFTGQSQSLQRFDPGTVIDMDSGQEFVATPFGQNVQGFQAAVQVLLRALAVKWNAPEWITSADASNGNFASSLVAESPFVRSIKRFQKHYATIFLRVVKSAVRHWITRRGTITVRGKKYDWQAVEKLVKIAITPPTAEVRDRAQEAQRDKTYLDMGVKSRQIIAEEQGIDYERVERDNEEYEKAHPQQQGGPGDGGPGGGGGLSGLLGGGGEQQGGGEQGPGDAAEAPGAPSPDEQPSGSGLAELLTEGKLLESDWSSYQGPHGGHGWKNAATGEVRYQDSMPSDASSDDRGKDSEVGRTEDASPSPIRKGEDSTSKPKGEWRSDDEERKFSGKDHHSAFMQHHEFYYKLPPEQKKALKAYTGTSYESINKVARGIPVSETELANATELIKHMDGIFEALPDLKKPLYVYRGMNLSTEEAKAILEKFQGAAESGESVEFANFMSTSFNPKVAQKFASKPPSGVPDRDRVSLTFEVRARRGMSMIDSSVEDEKELILPRAGKYRVVGVKEVPFKVKKDGVESVVKRRVIQLEQL